MAVRKGIVLDKGKDWAIILMPNGEYKKIKTHEYLEIGELYQEKVRLPIKYVAAAVILLAIVLTTIDYFSVQAYAQVSTLAELGVNRWGRVVSIQAKDNAGQHILDITKVKNDKLELAVEKICSQALKDEQSGNKSINKSELSVVSVKKAKPELEEKMLHKMDRGLQKVMHGQKQKERKGKTINNRTTPKDEFANEKNPSHKSPELQPQESRQHIKRGNTIDQNKYLDHQAQDRLEKKAPPTGPAIQQPEKHSDSELKRNSATDKDHDSQEYIHKDNSNH